MSQNQSKSILGKDEFPSSRAFHITTYGLALWIAPLSDTGYVMAPEFSHLH